MEVEKYFVYVQIVTKLSHDDMVLLRFHTLSNLRRMQYLEVDAAGATSHIVSKLLARIS